jgi:hypothetical protein
VGTEPLGEAERIKDAGCVRGELEAGADLVQRRGTLDYIDSKAFGGQGQRRREAGDARTDYGNRRPGAVLVVSRSRA